MSNISGVTTVEKSADLQSAPKVVTWAGNTVSSSYLITFRDIRTLLASPLPCKRVPQPFSVLNKW